MYRSPNHKINVSTPQTYPINQAVRPMYWSQVRYRPWILTLPAIEAGSMGPDSSEMDFW